MPGRPGGEEENGIEAHSDAVIGIVYGRNWKIRGIIRSHGLEVHDVGDDRLRDASARRASRLGKVGLKARATLSNYDTSVNRASSLDLFKNPPFAMSIVVKEW